MQQQVRLKSLLRRVWRQRRGLFYACIIVNLMRLALWLLPFAQVRKILTTVANHWRVPSGDPQISMAAIVWAVTVASIYTPGGSKCLVKALAVQLLLNRYGYAHQLHIGVTNGEENMVEAHAWIECDGHVIMGNLPDLQRFQPFANAGVML